MITLYSYPALFGVADNNGYGLKVYAFLKLAHLAFVHEHLFDASAAPRGQLPYIVDDGETIVYRASTNDCGPCPLKHQCCPKTPERKVTRSIYEEARDVARALAKTAAFAQSCCDRKRVEMLFAHLKRI